MAVDLRNQCASGSLCERPVAAHGVCLMHYKRLRNNGHLYVMRLRWPDDPERQRSKSRAYYLRHREERIAYQRRRRAANADAAREYERAVYQRRRAKHQASNRARARNMTALDADSLAYDAILRTDPCCYCGAAGGQVDHIIPVANDGPNHWGNLTAACRRCNRAKSSQSVLHHLARAA